MFCLLCNFYFIALPTVSTRKGMLIFRRLPHENKWHHNANPRLISNMAARFSANLWPNLSKILKFWQNVTHFSDFYAVYVSFSSNSPKTFTVLRWFGFYLVANIGQWAPRVTAAVNLCLIFCAQRHDKIVSLFLLYGNLTSSTIYVISLRWLHVYDDLIHSW